MKQFNLLATLCAGLAAMAMTGAAHAASITFTETAKISGTLDGTSFSNQTVTLTATTTTTGVSHSGSFYDEYVTLTGEIGSNPDFTFTDEFILSDNQSAGEVGFGDADAGGLLFTTASAFDSYELATAISSKGSITAGLGESFATSAGTLYLGSYSGSSTFTGVVSSVATTPEPSSLLLLGSGVLGFAGTSFRRLRRKA